MSESQSFQVFKRTVSDRFTTCKKALDATRNAFAGNKPDGQLKTTQKLNNALDDLSSILSDADKPKWLNSLLVATRNFVSNQQPTHANQLLEAIATHYTAVQPIQLHEDAPSPYDFDRIYEKAKSENRIAELFDDLIAAITKIIESGEVEVVTVLRSLQQAADVLKANRDGSFVSVRQSVWIARYIYHFVIAGLKKIGVTDVFIEAYEKTQGEVDKAMDQLDESMERECKAAILDALPKLTQIHDVIEQQRQALPSPEQKAIESDAHSPGIDD